MYTLSNSHLCDASAEVCGVKVVCEDLVTWRSSDEDTLASEKSIIAEHGSFVAVSVDEKREKSLHFLHQLKAKESCVIYRLSNLRKEMIQFCCECVKACDDLVSTLYHSVIDARTVFSIDFALCSKTFPLYSR